ncbi:hypothetical protein DFQ14_10614 [Halopolyspora algeriensis]|uniref:Ribonuclease VapC n=1 Tax=Halopolyspora algeriensis TaxID=1500506 RepID=A0A368VP87_9ACTN|nr:PIN domain nuclease [Halopolyspora algeriensis]RCW43539.1 hypothetical protein DFQ14_10614 [Halopolyspora algeriensis]TQM46408.1 hypothetical protein FHU43_4084 [Halopolyspora algeriensis]
MFLLDKSAFEQRRTNEQVAARINRHLSVGELATCEIIALEILYSARSAADHTAMRATLDGLEWLPVTNAVMQRALEVQALLAQRGQHRRPVPDLVIAATAEEHGAAVLHYDEDFDLIAEATGQPTEWITAPRGT